MINRTVRFLVCAAFGLALAGSGRALAQDTPAEGTTPAGGEATPPPAAPSAAASAPISATEATLHQGAISIDGDVVINLSANEAFKPVQIVPNFYYGVSSELTVGFVHNPGAEIFQAGGGVPTLGRGLCISGSSNGCPHFYDNFSLDALFSFLRTSTMDLAAHGGLDFLSLSDPFRMSLRLGIKGKTMAGPVMIVADPSLNIGLNNRDQANKEFVFIPLRLGYMVMPELNVGLSVALNGPTDRFGDFYTIPLGAGASYLISSALDVRAQFTFTNLAGKNGGGDGRALSIGAAYRM
ncbi:MAG TPA: hypothetical protein VN903_06065 [Polyangia bacterium]|jgi:hypothetical protein|nr:hypothetical protein [Polyangia bacterium]